MGKSLIVSLLIFSFAGSAMAATASEQTPAIQYSQDSNFLYVKQPLRVTLDDEQQAALKEGANFISAKIKNLQAQRAALDPNGDLKAITESISAMNAQLALLLTVANQVYGEVAPLGYKAFQKWPSAILVFGGISADRNLFRFAEVGGSVSLAAVLVPMHVDSYSLKTGKLVSSRVDWLSNSATIIIGVGLGGGKVSPSAVVGGTDVQTPGQDSNKSGRGGIGFVWGELNKASELTGLTGGLTATVDLGIGVNGKFLALKNSSKPGAVSNFILLLGVQKAGTLTGKIPFTNVSAEFGANAGYIVDAGGTLGSAGGFISDVAARISGNHSKDAAQ